MRLGAQGRAVFLVALALAAAGCAGRWAYRQGQMEARKGNWDMAVARLTKAMQAEPDNIDYRIALDNAKLQASRAHHHEAQKYLAQSELEKAKEELEIATNYDPSNQAFAADYKLIKDKIQARIDEAKEREEFDARRRRLAAQRASVPTLSPRSQVPITLNMPDASLQKILETLAQLAGVNILFDKDFRDSPASAKLTGVTFQEALDQITLVNRKFYKVLDSNTIIVAEEGAQQRRRLDESLVQTFYIQNADVAELQNTLRMMLQRAGPPPQLALNQNLRAITLAGNADEIALATKIVAAHDKPQGEVLVEVQILDVKRSNLKHYGIELANHEVGVNFDPFGAGAGKPIRAHLLSSLNMADFVVNLPTGIIARFLQTDSTAKILAAPKLRGADGKQTTLRIGTEVPIPVTQILAAAGQSSGTFAPATSIQYKNVGINMELTPRVNAVGEVTFDPIAAEFSLIGGERDLGGGLKAPEFLTRSVKGTLRIKDGETALIGGLIQGEDRNTMAGIIGVQSIPLLNRVLTSPDKEKTDSEILISITPHVVRGPRLSEEDLRSFNAGTKEMVKVANARPPLFGPEETPTPTPGPLDGQVAAPGQPPAPTTPPLGVAPPTPPVPPPPGEEGAPPAPAGPVASGGTAPPPGGALPGAEAPADEPAVMVLFSPPEVSIKVGDQSPVSVVVLRVKELVSVDIAVTYDPTALNAEDAEPGIFLTLDGSSVSSEKNLEPGRVRARFTRAGPSSRTASSGAVALLKFKGLKPGPTTVTIESLSLITPRGREGVTLPGPGRVVVLP
jgi:general secretion pathway protein D